MQINEIPISRSRKRVESLMARCSKQPCLLNVFSLSAAPEKKCFSMKFV